MSYDLSIWCTQPFREPNLLPSPSKWTLQDDCWTYLGRNWILNAGPSDKVQEEDVPDEVLCMLPGIAHVVHLSLEPIGAPKAGFTMLLRLARAVAKSAHGVIDDPQVGGFDLPPGIKRFRPPTRGKETRFALLKFSWWFKHSRVLEAAWIDSFLSLLERHLPESMPRRYGLYEPPQRSYIETGRDHLAEFLRQNLTDIMVWYANRPVIGWRFSIEPTCGWRRAGPKMQYRCNAASVSLDAAVLLQPGWPSALRRFWQKASLAFEPFYGDVRTLRGYTGRPPHISVGERHPIKSWWWKGIPPRLGHAVVVGNPYIDHWPELDAVAEGHNGLRFLSTDDWSSSQDAADLLNGVPAAIALPFMPDGWEMIYPETYPEVFPLGERPPDEAI